MRRIFAAALPLCLIAVVWLLSLVPADARPRGARIPVQQSERVVCDNDGRCRPHHQITPQAFGGASVAPSRYIAGQLVCAVNVNAALAERGIRGTGSALAKSFLNWGHASGPVPGAVAVYNRKGKGKGHVAIVSRVEGGTVYVLNPGRRGWHEVAYPKRAIAYRVAS